MFAKRLVQKAIHHHHNHHPDSNVSGCVTSTDLDIRIPVHYGIPSTASVLAFDPIQRLLAIGTLDGRIKVIGGNNIEGLLISPKQLPYKFLEFLPNQGFLVSILNDNDIQVWNLENRSIACTSQWESNITAFSVICGSPFMYIGDEYGLLSVLKYDADDEALSVLPYHISADSLVEAAGSSFPYHQPIVGVLPQPCSSGNRVLIAYESGLIILWDVVEARVVVVRGDKVLELKDGINYSQMETNLSDDKSGEQWEDREISALCWASSYGSILAVGYMDGDILFWKTTFSATSRHEQAKLLPNSVIKLQLSSAERRLPVILLHWSASNKSKNDGDGQLFIYGGDEIGSDEVLTVLSLEWSSGMETVRCVGRVDLTLTGSFADMILLPTAGAILSNHNAALFVLTSPGQLHFFDRDSISDLASQEERKIFISPLEYPAVIPTVDPIMTVTKIRLLSKVENSIKAPLEVTTHMKYASTPTMPGNAKWPLTGGVANQMSFDVKKRVERIYAAGYEDGSVRIWDATYPVLSLLYVLEGEVKGIEFAGASASVSKLDYCSLTSGLAVGNKCGLVFFYDLSGSSNDTSFHFVTESKHEVHNLPQGKDVNCRAVFSLFDSQVQALQFINSGAKLSIGYDCGRVAVVDLNSLSTSFITDVLSSPSSPVISMTWNKFMDPNSLLIKSPKNSDSGSKAPGRPAEEMMFLLTKDAKVYVIDGGTGNIISSRPMKLKESVVISMYVIERNTTVSELINHKELSHEIASSGTNQPDTDHHSSSENKNFGASLKDSMVLLCCKDVIRLYNAKFVLQGENKSTSKVKLAKSCCWTTTFKKDDRICGLVLLYYTGEIEIRSLPDLKLGVKTSLMSTLRWNFKAGMERTLSSTDNGHITLINGREVAFISLITSENDFRIPESLPCLHDKVLAAATETAISFSSNQKKKQGNAPGFLEGIVKGFKAGKRNSTMDLVADLKLNCSHLEGIFSKNPFPDPSLTTTDDQESLVNIDDIEIDEPVPVASTSSHKGHNIEKDKRTEREKLFGGDGSDAKPRLRTREEIIATYRKAADASTVAGQARNKLLERGEKLEKISKRTEELQNGAEDFASLAAELAKVMERRKWWQI